MSADDTRQQTQKADTPDESRSAAEVWVEQVGSYWGRAIVSAWRTVFPPRKDTQ
jgi:hypothetical protein